MTLIYSLIKYPKVIKYQHLTTKIVLSVLTLGLFLSSNAIAGDADTAKKNIISRFTDTFNAFSAYYHLENVSDNFSMILQGDPLVVVTLED